MQGGYGPLQNYLRWQYGVENTQKMLVQSN